MPEAEPYMHFVDSVVHGGQRVRVLENGVLIRPIEEPFHQFLAGMARWALGSDWWDEQSELPEDDRHIVFSWATDWADFTAAHTDNEHADAGRPTFSADAPGTLWALVTFGYDLYCLLQTDHLPVELIKRLRNRDQFQGARYEVAVAAIMKRAGFDLEFIDDATATEKHSEFIATDRHGSTRLAVEAKSRHRPGVLHTEGEFQYDGDWKGLARLVRDALAKVSGDLPLIVFVDVNLPHAKGSKPEDKPWLNDLSRAMEAVGKPTQADPDGFALLFATSFSDHFAGLEELAPPGEWVVVVPSFSAVPLRDAEVRDRIIEVVGRYGEIPDLE